MKTLKLAATAAILSATSISAQAAGNPFQATELSSGYQVSMKAEAEGRCGEGKCGGVSHAEKTASEGKCGGKGMEGKCGGDKDDKKPLSEGKCGERKCGK